LDLEDFDEEGATAMTIATLAGGSWIFLAFLIIAFFGVAYGYFTVKGSGITPRSYGKIYSSSPGAKFGGDASGRDRYERMNNWSRGTR
jgi:hypothetical protein